MQWRYFCGLGAEASLVKPIYLTVEEFLGADKQFTGTKMDAHCELARSSIRFMLLKDFDSISSLLI